MINLKHDRSVSPFVSNSMLSGMERSEKDSWSVLRDNTEAFFGSCHHLKITSGQSENAAVVINTMLERLPSLRILSSVLDDFSALISIMPPNVDTEMLAVDSNAALVGFEEALKRQPNLVILTLANEETGAVTDIVKYADAAKRAGAFVYVDATFGAPYMSMRDVPACVDIVGVCANKLGGPGALGMLWSRFEMSPLFYRMNASKDPNMLGIAAMSLVLFETKNRLDSRVSKVRELRDRLDQKLSRVEGISVNCWNAPRVANISSYSFRGADARVLYLILRKMGILTMYTCESFEGSTMASPLMYSLHEEKDVNSNLRIELCEKHTEEDIDLIYKTVSTVYEELIKLNTRAVRRKVCRITN